MRRTWLWTGVLLAVIAGGSYALYLYLQPQQLPEQLLYATTLDVENIRIGVLDHDRSAASRQLVDEFVQSGYFRLAGVYSKPQEAEDALQRNAVKLALVIPPGFQEGLARRETAPIQVLVDGSYSASASLAVTYAESIIARFPEVVVVVIGTPLFLLAAWVFRRTPTG